MRSVFTKGAASYRQGYLGEVLPVLWEATDRFSTDGWRLSGLTGNYLRVYALSREPLWNHFSPVRLIREVTDGVEGEIVSEPTRLNCISPPYHNE